MVEEWQYCVRTVIGCGVNPVRSGSVFVGVIIGQGGVAINQDANLLPASEAILLPADTNNLIAKSPTGFPVITLTILATVSNIPPPPTTRVRLCLNFCMTYFKLN
jgi:hypothetical protein